ncbi:uncharacterized protein LOC106709012 [Papilio machaon]|uniref:uncharacterized protein LOC106709012 n=1 Tax=Papilio machaon TaxID=76193 RepID=UPI001E663249|nr:uncharacterized protein LOC106709012 [Papilio machaon]
MAEQYSDDEETLDVRSLPLRPPRPLLPPEKPVRRAWHPVMWDDHKDTAQKSDEPEQSVQSQHGSREYPHTQRIRNLRRLIAEGKVKPESETLIFFLCNKFAVSDDRRKKFE